MLSETSKLPCLTSYCIYLPVIGVQECVGGLVAIPLDTLTALARLPGIKRDEWGSNTVPLTLNREIAQFRVVMRSEDFALAVQNKARRAMYIQQFHNHTIICLIEPGTKPNISVTIRTLMKDLAMSRTALTPFYKEEEERTEELAAREEEEEEESLSWSKIPSDF